MIKHQNHIIDSLSTYFKVFDNDLSKPQVSHFQSWITAIIHGEVHGSQIAQNFSNKHPSSLTRFLSQSSWDHYLINETRVLHTLNVTSQSYSKYQCYLIDDTVTEKYGKQLPGIGYHWSHPDSKAVWSQNLVTSHAVIGNTDFPIFADLYHKDTKVSKIDLAIKQINQFPNALPRRQCVVLADSWYGSRKVIKACLNRQFTFLTQLKCNGLIKVRYRKKYKPISLIAERLAAKNDFKQVTLEGTKYRYSLIKGNLKQFRDRLFNILIAQQYDEKDKEWSSFHYLLSTDTNMGGWTMLFLYRKRWKIETFYKFGKEKLGLASSRVLTPLSLSRFVLLLFIAYTFLTLSKYSLSTFFNQEIEKDSYYGIQSQVIRECKKQMIVWVYIQGQLGYPLDQMLIELQLIKKTA